MTTDVNAAAATAAQRVDNVASKRGPGAPLRGKTSIADDVVAKVAGITTRQVTGVHALGGGGARAVGAIREALNTTDYGQGVRVEVGDTQAAVDITLVADFGVALQDLANHVRTSVTDAVENIVGLDVVEVNVDVADVYIASHDDAGDGNERVN